MSDIEDELLTDLNAIDVRTEKLREELGKLPSTTQITKSSVVPDSGVDVMYGNQGNSVGELNYTMHMVWNTGHAVGHTRYPGPGYTLYEDKQTVDRTFLKDTENKLPHFDTILQPIFTKTYLTPRPSMNTRCSVFSSVSSTVTWSKNHSPVQAPVYRHAPTLGMSNDLDARIKEHSYGKTPMKPATYSASWSWIDYKAHFEACSDLNCWNLHQKSVYLK
jgi:hypothetical protein